QQVRRTVRAAQDAESDRVGVEVVERLSATSGDRAELDEALVEHAGLVASSASVDRRHGAGVEATVAVRTAVQRQVIADEGAQGAVSGRGAGVDVDAATSAGAVRVLNVAVREGLPT